MLRWSGKDEAGNNVFSFILDHFKPPVVIVSPTEAVMIEPTYLTAIIDRGYGRNLTQAEAESAVVEGDIVEETGAELAPDEAAAALKAVDDAAEAANAIKPIGGGPMGPPAAPKAGGIAPVSKGKK
jgi:hypothetical protein